MPGLPRPVAAGARGAKQPGSHWPPETSRASWVLGLATCWAHIHTPSCWGPGISLRFADSPSGLPCLRPRSQGLGLPCRQEALGPAPGGLVSREAWLVIPVAMWSPVAAPRGVGLCSEAVPGLGPLVSPLVAHLSSRLQGGAEERGGAEGCPLPLGTLYPSGVCSAAAGSQKAAGRQVPSPACASCHLGQVGALWGDKLGWRLLSAGPSGARGALGVTAPWTRLS